MVTRFNLLEICIPPPTAGTRSLLFLKKERKIYGRILQPQPPCPLHNRARSKFSWAIPSRSNPSMSSFAVVVLVLLNQFASASASTGPSEPAFVPAPSGRGTIDLVTSCVFTLSLCVWTAIHLNIPRPGLSWWRYSTRKLLWAIAAGIMPEYVLAQAFQQLAQAREISKTRNACLPTADVVPETAVKLPHAPCPHASARCETAGREPWTLEHGYFALMGGFVLKSKYTEATQTPSCTITVQGILRLTKLGILVDVSLTTIRQKSKSSCLAKALVCFQVSWMLIQTIARAFSRLPVTLLELNTLSHVGCAILMYALWWFKPQDVYEPVMIDIAECSVCNVLLAQTNFYASSYLREESPNDEEWVEDGSIVIRSTSRTIFLLVLNLAYGAVHAGAWNEHFPSVVEQNFWRAAASAVLLGSLCMALLIYYHKQDWQDDFGRVTSSIIFLGLLLYFTARLFLITEAFLSVRSLPIGAYDTVRWGDFLQQK